MRHSLRGALLLSLALRVAAFGPDHLRGTSAEAEAMLFKAIAHYKAVGKNQALADFTARKPPFRDRDLYVFCFGPDHVVLANGGFSYDVGNSGDTVVDAKGKGIATAAWEAVRSQKVGIVHYRRANPHTHDVEPKMAFFAKAGGDVCGVGAYSPKK